jgi:hypothetical protein
MRLVRPDGAVFEFGEYTVSACIGNAFFVSSESTPQRAFYRSSAIDPAVYPPEFIRAAVPLVFVEAASRNECGLYFRQPSPQSYVIENLKKDKNVITFELTGPDTNDGSAAYWDAIIFLVAYRGSLPELGQGWGIRVRNGAGDLVINTQWAFSPLQVDACGAVDVDFGVGVSIPDAGIPYISFPTSVYVDTTAYDPVVTDPYNDWAVYQNVLAPVFCTDSDMVYFDYWQDNLPAWVWPYNEPYPHWDDAVFPECNFQTGYEPTLKGIGGVVAAINAAYYTDDMSKPLFIYFYGNELVSNHDFSDGPVEWDFSSQLDYIVDGTRQYGRTKLNAVLSRFIDVEPNTLYEVRHSVFTAYGRAECKIRNDAGADILSLVANLGDPADLATVYFTTGGSAARIEIYHQAESDISAYLYHVSVKRADEFVENISSVELAVNNNPGAVAYPAELDHRTGAIAGKMYRVSLDLEVSSFEYPRQNSVKVVTLPSGVIHSYFVNYLALDESHVFDIVIPAGDNEIQFYSAPIWISVANISVREVTSRSY